MAEEMELRNAIKENVMIKEEKEQLDQILRWKWMIAGGIIAVSWIVAHGEKFIPFLKS